MERSLAFLILTLSLSFLNCINAQSFLWGREGTTFSDVVNGVAADSKGNVYLAGIFTDSISFDTNHLTSVHSDAYLVKYDSNGNIIWVRQSNSISVCCGVLSCMVWVDDSDNVYITGTISQATTHFGNVTLSTSLGYNIFIVKYNSNGTSLWGVQTNDRKYNPNEVTGITTDDSANVIITGYFYDSLYFGPIKLFNPYAVAGPELFIAKYGYEGSLRWVKESTPHDSSSCAFGNSVTSDRFGNITVTGLFRDTVNMYASILSTTANNEMFLVKYSPNGNVLWQKQSNTCKSGSCWGTCVAVDNEGNLYLTGNFYDTANIGGLQVTNNSSEMFLVKFDSAGNPIWINLSNTGWYSSCLFINKYNNLFFSAYPWASGGGNIYFCNEHFMLPTGSFVSVYMEIDTSGNGKYGTMIGTAGDDVNSITSSPDGKFVFIGGDLDDTITFGSDFLNDFNTEPPFVARWDVSAIYTVEQNRIQNNLYNLINVFPNPSSGIFNFQAISQKLTANSRIEVYNVLGEKVFSISSQKSQMSFDLTGQPNGVYFYRVEEQKESGSESVLGSGKIVVDR